MITGNLTDSDQLKVDDYSLNMSCFYNYTILMVPLDISDLIFKIL